jgi:hypothetical protein
LQNINKPISSTSKEARDKYHYNFKVGTQTDLLGYKGVNLDSTIEA